MKMICLCLNGCGELSVNFASCDVDGFSNVDDDILTTETLTVEDIVTEVKKSTKQCS